MLLTKEEIENVLEGSLKDVPKRDIEQVTRQLIEAQGQWHELDLTDNLGAEYSCQCRDICGIGAAHANGQRIRAFVSD